MSPKIFEFHFRKKSFFFFENEQGAKKTNIFGRLSCKFQKPFLSLQKKYRIMENKKVTVITKKPFEISQRSLDFYNQKELENTLTSINNATKSSAYIMDYYNEKIIVDSDSSLVLCGHSKAVADQQGFGFFEHVLSDAEWKHLQRANEKAYEMFFYFPENRRRYLSFSYNMKMLTAKGNDLVLNHNFTPYKMCKNGNLWLSLCNVSISDQKDLGFFHIIDNKTGDQYNFIDNKFVKTEMPFFSQEEKQILKWLTKDLSNNQMSELLSMSLANFKRKKLLLFEKLQASTSAGAVSKGYLAGII